MGARAGTVSLLLALLAVQAAAAPTPSSPTPAATPAATPAPNVLTAAAALLGNVLGTPVTSPTPAVTAASPPPVRAPPPPLVPPPPAARPPPAANTSVPAPGPPPPPMNPNATALFATLQMQGDIWPFSKAAANAVVQALSQTLTTVTISGINIINATQVGGRRRLLMDTVNLYLELEGTSPAAALAINSDLGNNVLNGNLQNTLARTGLPVSGLSLTYSNAVQPMANFACTTGSFDATCLSSGSGLSKGSIIGIAVGAAVGGLLLVLLCVTCVLRCAASARADNPGRIVPNRKAMTPQHAQPFWEQNKLEAEGGSIALAATAAGTGAPVRVPAGVLHAETREMGGRAARDQLKMRLPEFAGRTSRQPSGISHQPSGISRAASLAQTKSLAPADGHGPQP